MSQENHDMWGSRRQFLLTTSATIGTIGIAGTSSAETGSMNSNPDWDEFRASLVDEYGRVEARIATEIVRKCLKKANREEWTDSETGQRIKKNLQSRPRLDRIQQDIQRTQTDRRRHQSQTFLPTATTEEVSSFASTSSTELSLDQEWTDKNAYMNTRTEADVRKQYDIVHALVNSAVYGSGNATARLYTDFSPSAEGTWEVAVKYLRKASVEGGATVTLSAFTKDSFNGVRKRTLEELSSSAQGTVTRGTSIHLDNDTTYDIGFEIRVEGSAGGLAAFGDAYNNPGWNQTRRRAKVWDFKVRKR